MASETTAGLREAQAGPKSPHRLRKRLVIVMIYRPQVAPPPLDLDLEILVVECGPYDDLLMRRHRRGARGAYDKIHFLAVGHLSLGDDLPFINREFVCRGDGPQK
jgi:hypothetical protein